MKRLMSLLLSILFVLGMTACGQNEVVSDTDIDVGEETITSTSSLSEEREVDVVNIPDNFVFIEGGTFQMGSPETESWRSDDETQHTVTVSDFYMSQYEITQAEYEEIIGSNPSNFSGSNLPVENLSWLDAAAYCNGAKRNHDLGSEIQRAAGTSNRKMKW